MINHVWGLLSRPTQEWKNIRGEGETITHMYAHHVLLLALIPAISAFLGTTQIGWRVDTEADRVAVSTGLAMALTFYVLILVAVGIMGNVIHWMSERFNNRPSRRRCVLFAGYTATPLFIGGLALLYPSLILWAIVGVIAVAYTGYLLYTGYPTLLGVSLAEGFKEGFTITGGTLAIGVLVLELLLAATVALWGLGFDFGVSWSLFPGR
ncbi:Yip1 family protein [Pseudomonas matsuisoli]|uniref:Membrane protein n=1 Tax=Pseudomonas matsuisoli TaxID=1515666 RepID=A0A917PYQ1_9PSED|nr:Yip1 family protein [Pseudomonas matsuisoli]GGK00272.1 membrane protein [Pseudomonas matsuisoli]